MVFSLIQVIQMQIEIIHDYISLQIRDAFKSKFNFIPGIWLVENSSHLC